MVVLGDPGSGKSTLVKLITYSFGRSEPTPLSRRFGPLLPIPIILRDYHVTEWRSESDMLADFVGKLDEGIRNEVTVEWLLAAMREGRAFLMLDGLDEVGNHESRLKLVDNVVNPLLTLITEGYALITSRIVGFDGALFRGRLIDLNEDILSDPEMELEFGQSYPEFMARVTRTAQKIKDKIEGSTESAPLLTRYYVAPFAESDAEQFITRWYTTRERNRERRREGIRSLSAALQQNDRIKRLATNPSLLTLMALVHRVTAHLPSGRVKLYDKIVEAYLETIQVYRKLEQYPASLDQMKRWLARVGWEMHSLRGRQGYSDLLVGREVILNWLTEAIGVDRPDAEEEARQFLDYVARRSGLLIERGTEQFSFVHLTFQEYFAAFYLRGRLGHFDQLVETCASLVSQREWHETLGLLFEMLAEFPGVGDDLLTEIDKRVSENDARVGAGELFSTLLLDDQSGLGLRTQERAPLRSRYALQATTSTKPSLLAYRNSQHIASSLGFASG